MVKPHEGSTLPCSSSNCDANGLEPAIAAIGSRARHHPIENVVLPKTLALLAWVT